MLRSLAFNRGDLWMLAAVAIWAAYTLLLKRRPHDLPPTVTLAAAMGLGAALMLPVAILTPPSLHLVVSPDVLGALAYIVIFPSVLAFWLWGYGVARMGPERAGQFVHLMPIFGPVLAMALLGERMVPAQIGGAIVIFAGIALVIRRPEATAAESDGRGECSSVPAKPDAPAASEQDLESPAA